VTVVQLVRKFLSC